MKTQRRHELQNNDLAERLGGVMFWFEENYKSVLGVAVALAVIVGIYVALSRSSAAKVEESWNSYYAAVATQSTDSVRKVAEDFPGTTAATWARLWLADQFLQVGVDQLFQDRAQANDELRRAIDEYKVVLQERTDPLIAQRANLGLARAHESLDQLEEARAIYRELADDKKWPNGAFTKEAASRLADLERQPMKEFYDWFAQQDPKPSISGSGLGHGIGGTPFTAPSFDSQLPDEPGAEGLGKTIFPGGTTPAASDPAASGEAATGEAPATEPAAASETPAADVPATEPPAAETPAETPPAAAEPAATP